MGAGAAFAFAFASCDIVIMREVGLFVKIRRAGCGCLRGRPGGAERADGAAGRGG